MGRNIASCGNLLPPSGSFHKATFDAAITRFEAVSAVEIFHTTYPSHPLLATKTRFPNTRLNRERTPT